MTLPEGAPGSRTDYTLEITAREKEACERFSKGNYLPDDPALVDDVLRKIALLPKKVSSMNCPGSPNAA